MKRSVEIAIHLAFFFFATLFVLLLYEFITRGYAYQISNRESIVPLKFYWQFEQPRREMLMIASFTLWYGIVTFYAFYAFFKPILFDRKLYGLFIISIILWIGGLVAYRAFIMRSWYHPALVVRDILIPSLFILSGTAFRFLKDWFTNQKQKDALQKQNLQIQLDLLKARISPHFLFNTINNIDVLIKKDPSVASEYLYKLSDTLRYVLYETREEKIPLKNEVEQIQKFIDLQRIRTSNPEYVNFSLSGTIENQKIAPMIFMTFIENAIKFTSNKKISNAVGVTLDVQGSFLHFNCRNYSGEEEPRSTNDSGLGLDLTIKRLELIYNGRYELEAGRKEKWYIVDLKIHLDDH
jgi:two-component system LytT family sensor kinase